MIRLEKNEKDRIIVYVDAGSCCGNLDYKETCVHDLFCGVLVDLYVDSCHSNSCYNLIQFYDVLDEVVVHVDVGYCCDNFHYKETCVHNFFCGGL